MKLSKKQFCEAVNNYEEMIKEENIILDTLNINPEWIPSKWVDTYYKLLNDVCELKSDPLYGNDLDWFCFDTNFGKREEMCEVRFENRTWRVTTPEILYDLIMEQQN